MRLLRIGDPGAEVPAVLDAAGTARDVSGITGDFGPAFFAGGGLAALAAAVADPAALAGLPPLAGQSGKYETMIYNVTVRGFTTGQPG